MLASRSASRQARTPERKPTAVATRRFFSGVIVGYKMETHSGAMFGDALAKNTNILGRFDGMDPSSLKEYFRGHLKAPAQLADVLGI